MGFYQDSGLYLNSVFLLSVMFFEKSYTIGSEVSLERIETGLMKPNEMQFYLDTIVSYAQGNSGMSWDENGNLVIF